MQEQQLIESDRKDWHVRIFKAYWAVIAIATATEFGIYVIENLRGIRLGIDYLIRYILYPTGIGISVLLVGSLILRRYLKMDPWWFPYLIIFIGELLALNLSLAHLDVKVIYASFVMPIFLSVLYFRYPLIRFALLTSASSILLIFFLIPDSRIYLDVKNLFTIGAILWIGKVLASAILAKGQKLISDLRTAIESEQELKIKTILMEKDSKIEMLTGLYNHITFHEYLDNLISQCRNDEFQIQLAVIDIDDFKLINDNYGHRAGDKVILEISNIIRSIADQNDFVCRYGGEEFAVILTDKTFHQAIHTMEQIREAIQNHEFDILDYNKVTVSIGLQNYHNEYSKDYLFEGADKAMYMAKKAGKNRLVTKM